jgi:hypothetical protein
VRTLSEERRKMKMNSKMSPLIHRWCNVDERACNVDERACNVDERVCNTRK